jgi:hypothetical protein
MSTPPEDHDLVLLEKARTPDEAQVIAGVLKGEGIPVFVGGTSLTDEFAVSRRMLNLLSVEVMVRRHELEAARTALAEARQVDAGELEQQALAAASPAELAPVRAQAPAVSPPVGRHWPWVAAGLGILAVVFLLLWLAAERKSLGGDEPYRYEYSENGVRALRRDTGLLAIEYLNSRKNGGFGEVRWYDDQGRLQLVQYETDRFGRARQVEEHRTDGTRLLSRDQDFDGMFDTHEVRDASGKTLRKERYKPGEGFVPE